MSHEDGRKDKERKVSPPTWQQADYETEIAVGETLDEAVDRARAEMESRGGKSFNVFRTGERGKTIPAASERRTTGYEIKKEGK
ncbi:MAG TPA: hypothetical protein PK109_03105 [Candidatus Paceibacterota bacterium]|nr:hypothetical protein [Candidatus Paceibacterota bacterium]